MNSLDCNEKANETGKTSPVSLSSVENQSPIAEELLMKNVEKVETKMTLGQTLKNELRKSSMQLSQQQKHGALKRKKQEEPAEDSSEELVNENNCVETNNSAKAPVWQYFNMEMGTAKCRHCDYKIKSGFRTNLKTHLKTHHRNLFDKVFFLFH